VSLVDLHLIRTFLGIYETRSLTRTAEALHVTQPSVSYALRRLRAELKDPLFIRDGSGMHPTVHAKELYETFSDSIRRIDAVVEARTKFDAKASTKTFRLCLTDLGEIAFVPPVLRGMNRSAPDAVLEVVPMRIDEVGRWLAIGEVDAAIASVSIPGARHVDVIRDEHYVCIMSSEAAGQSKTLTLEEFTAARHVIIDPALGHQQVDNVLESLGIRRKISLRMHHFSVLPNVVTTENYLAIVPLQIARLFAAQWPLVIRELPFSVPSFNVSLYWSAGTESSPSQAWFRKTVIESIASRSALEE
jgi:DNA-binding transcriptional LysR family regulator